jgi:hypothetical protein
MRGGKRNFIPNCSHVIIAEFKDEKKFGLCIDNLIEADNIRMLNQFHAPDLRTLKILLGSI